MDTQDNQKNLIFHVTIVMKNGNMASERVNATSAIDAIAHVLNTYNDILYTDENNPVVNINVILLTRNHYFQE